MLLKQKKKGLSTMIGAIFMVFLLFVLFFFSYYMKAIETLKINMKDDADMATMAAVTVDLDKYGKDHKDLYCIGSTDFNNPNGERNNHKANTTEQNEVYKHLNLYAKSLISTMGLKSAETDSFSGGNVGWAANSLGAQNFKLDNFKIYEYSQTKRIWICYTVTGEINAVKLNAVKNNENNAFNGLTVTKKQATEDEVQTDGIDISKPSPTVCATFSFELSLPHLFADTNPDVNRVNNLSIKSVSQTKEF